MAKKTPNKSPQRKKERKEKEIHMHNEEAIVPTPKAKRNKQKLFAAIMAIFMLLSTVLGAIVGFL